VAAASDVGRPGRTGRDGPAALRRPRGQEQGQGQASVLVAAAEHWGQGALAAGRVGGGRARAGGRPWPAAAGRVGRAGSDRALAAGALVSRGGRRRPAAEESQGRRGERDRATT
jgi:hypothetical protein